MTDRLAGKVCIITGTSGTIGRASALAFAREGARIVGTGLNVQRAEETLEAVTRAGGAMASMQPCDLTRPDHCNALLDLTLNTFGQVDVLFNNAGRAKYAWIEDLSYEDWTRTLEQELSIAFLLTKTVWPALAQRGGAIINMASIAAWIGFKPLGAIAYGASKAGIVAMTRQLAMEGRKHGIRANSISPGTVATPRTTSRLQDPVWADQILSRIMRGTLGKPEEIANVALFLASNESSFVNGADIAADGGMSAW